MLCFVLQQKAHLCSLRKTAFPFQRYLGGSVDAIYKTRHGELFERLVSKQESSWEDKSIEFIERSISSSAEALEKVRCLELISRFARTNCI